MDAAVRIVPIGAKGETFMAGNDLVEFAAAKAGPSLNVARSSGSFDRSAAGPALTQPSSSLERLRCLCAMPISRPALSNPKRRRN
jgi:enoyl-CoA hydratase/carnithine racemase